MFSPTLPKRRSRAVAVLATAAAVVTLLVGCTSASAKTTAAVSPSAALPTSVPSGTVLHVADQGQTNSTLFATSGLTKNLTSKVQFSEFNGQPEVLEALRAGAADVASGGDVGPTFAQAQGLDIVVVGAVRTSRNYYGFYTAPGNGDITSVAQLKGKKIAYAAGTSLGLYTLRVLHAAGLSKKDVTLVNLTIADIPDALKTSQVDAGAIYEPNKTNFTKQYGSKGLHALAEGHDKGSGLGYLYATRAALDDPAKLAALRNFVSVWTTASLWKNTHLQEYSTAYYEGVQKLDPSVALTIAKSSGTVTIPALDDKLIAEQQRYINFLRTAGELPKKLDAADEFDTRFSSVQAKAAKQ